MARILLVEGDERDAARVRDSLRPRDEWELVNAGTLLEAIRAAGETRFDAAILDADLPDGSGLDILDFLRIGSPGIRIMLLARRADEAIAFHALSRGAGDLVVKDRHLELELPRRLDALLDAPAPFDALVETLAPLREAGGPPAIGAREAPPDAGALDAVLADVVQGEVLAAGVWDLLGKPLAVKLPPDMDPAGAGFALATLHGQVGALWTYGGLKPTGYRLLVDVEGGMLGISAIPGTYVLGILFDDDATPRRALDRLDQVGVRVVAALLGGGSGADLSP